MISPPDRRRRPAARTLVAVGLLVVAPLAAHAAPEVVATRGLPSSLSARYGQAAPIGDPTVAGPYVVATGSGIEIRDSAIGGAAPVGVFRTPGTIDAVAVDAATAYLFAGEAGIVAVNVSVLASPTALGSITDLGDVTLGAASSDGYGILAASDRGLQFLTRSGPGQISWLATIKHPDNRIVGGIAAHGDSFLVASARTSPIQRMFLTLYRLQQGSAAPESLWGAAFPNRTANGLSWNGDVAFVGDGNSGVLSVDIPSGVSHIALVGGGKYVRSVAANATTVTAVAEAGTYSKFARSGAAGDVLTGEVLTSLPLEPTHVTLQGDAAILSTEDNPAAVEPDETGASQIEIRSLSGPSTLGPYGGTGRTRRIVYDSGYAYVADYTGGFRIYRASGIDTSLVGALGPTTGARVVDLALDPVRQLAYLASSSAGLQVVSVADPAAPALLGTLVLPGQASAVAIAGSDLIAVGRRGGGAAGVTFVNVAIASAPVPRGQVNFPRLVDPRAISVRDTIAFVADASLGLVSVGFGNPDAPGTVGLASGVGALSLDLAPASTILLVGTSGQGLQIVDVSHPESPAKLSEVAAPPVLGVGRSGSTAILLMGVEQALVVDFGSPLAPEIEGAIAMPARPRSAVWIGDTLLVATGLALERLRVSPTPVALPALSIAYQAGGRLSRASITWSPVSVPGMVGLDLRRDVVSPPAATGNPAGIAVNPSMLPPTATGVVDDSLEPGFTYRYRLEAALSDGSSQEVAEGSLSVPSSPGVGPAYPNPYISTSGSVTVPYQLAVGSGGGTLEFRVFDVRGNLVWSLALAVPSGGGFGSAAWSGKNQNGDTVAAGVYFLKLSGLGIDDARQVVLLH